jgi:cyclic pyranopterin phosphate synthase
LDLRAILRKHPGDEERLRGAIVCAMQLKPQGHEFEAGIPAVVGRNMNVTGG